MPPLSTHIIYFALTQIVNKTSARNCWYCREDAYVRVGSCMKNNAVYTAVCQSALVALRDISDSIGVKLKSS